MVRNLFVLLFVVVTGSASAAADFASLFKGLPHAEERPTTLWVKKVLDRVVNVHRVGSVALGRYLGAPDRATALSMIIVDNPKGFRDRLLEFNLNFVEFMPKELYVIDPVSGKSMEAPELSSLTNTGRSADEVWKGGNFFTLYDFPWSELPLRGSPASPKPEDQLLFRHDINAKPFFRILNTSPNNRNRKRAAWVLRNFLCDDLTPASSTPSKKNAKPADMAMHTGSPMSVGVSLHAMDVNCRSCHWKLDYIGAFFRYLAPWGHDWKGKGRYLEILPVAIYKDAEWDEYMSDWNDQAGKWLAGVRRGNLEVDPTDWNASDKIADPTQTDLFQYLKSAPESQRCVAKRMADKYINDNLAYDTGWLDSLGARFAAVPEAQSGQAFLKVLGEIAFSRAMATPNPDPNQCYDTAVGKPASNIPCRIYRIFEGQCLSCHRNKNFNLDLRDLVAKNGGGQWVDHTGDDGRALDPEASFRLIMERLNSNDPDFRMPMGKPALSVEDKATIAEWLTQLKEKK